MEKKKPTDEQKEELLDAFTEFGESLIPSDNNVTEYAQNLGILADGIAELAKILDKAFSYYRSQRKEIDDMLFKCKKKCNAFYLHSINADKYKIIETDFLD